MSAANPTCELLLRYLDDTLPAEERRRAEELLRVDPAAREIFRSLAQHAVVIADCERVRQVGNPLPKQSRTISGQRSKLQRTLQSLLVVAAVALAAVTVSQLVAQHSGESSIITIKALSGPAEWTGDGGRVTKGLTVGQELSGGTIELMSPGSWIEFEFRDNSRVALSGQTAVTISERTQKELRVRYGSLSANVKPQVVDRPMLVHTPTAKLIILGTQFNVEALTDSTWLAVTEGSVRLTRLTDGQQVDVTARHAVAASIQDQQRLVPAERSDASTVWKSDLKIDVVRGKWVSDLWMLALKLKASVASGELDRVDALKMYKNAATLDHENGSVWTEASPYGSLVVLSASQSTATPVLLNANSTVRIKGQLHSPTSVRFGISTRNADGGFAGKYSVNVADSQLGSDGVPFVIELSMNHFEKKWAGGDSPIGKELSDWWCVTDSMSAELVITSVEIVESLVNRRP